MTKSKAFRFEIIRSGDGKKLTLGHGTLRQGTALIKRFDRLFEKASEDPDFSLRGFTPFERRILRSWEGCDVYAVRGRVPNEELYIYEGIWEEC